MTPGSRLNIDIESACMRYGLCVLPRGAGPVSVWSIPDPKFHAGVIWRQNTGAARYGRSLVRFGPPGRADYQGWLFLVGNNLQNGGRSLQIEGKAGKDTLNANQLAHASLCVKTGVLWGCVASYDDCCLLLASWGLKSHD